MLASERVAFAKLVETLCAGYNVPATEARIDAYWRGCHGMALGVFELLIDYAVGPDGDDDLPTPKRLYAIDRKRRSELRAAELAGKRAQARDGDEPPKEPDRFDCYAGRVLFAVLCKLTSQHGSTATDESLAEMVHVKHNYANSYRLQCASEPDASLEMRDALIIALTRRFVPRERTEQFTHRMSVPAPGETWANALAALEASNAPGGRNAPAGSAQWSAR